MITRMVMKMTKIMISMGTAADAAVVMSTNVGADDDNDEDNDDEYEYDDPDGAL